MTQAADSEGTSPLRPRALAAGARVALVAPAGPLAPEAIERSTELCLRLGLEPVLFPSVRRRLGYLAGTDHERARDLQDAFDDPRMDAIWALRGGYGTLRILDRLDLGRQQKDPIPYIGFSDHTTLHARHLAEGVVSFHGPHPGAAFPPETQAFFRRVLFDPAAAGPLPSRPHDPAPRTLVGGRVEARLVGGNLALLAALCGSRHSVKAQGRILFLEEVGEAAYRVDRMLVQLERAGVFRGILGLALGRFTESPEGDGEAVVGLVTDLAHRLDVPAVLDLPFGHVEHNCVLPVGGLAALDADAAVLSLVDGAVRARS
jgi:muramoyltetrapeptide carboxypeptidase